MEKLDLGYMYYVVIFMVSRELAIVSTAVGAAATWDSSGTNSGIAGDESRCRVNKID